MVWSCDQVSILHKHVYGKNQLRNQMVLSGDSSGVISPSGFMYNMMLQVISISKIGTSKMFQFLR